MFVSNGFERTFSVQYFLQVNYVFQEKHYSGLNETYLRIVYFEQFNKRVKKAIKGTCLISTDEYKADIYYRETSYWAEIFLKGNWGRNIVIVDFNF